MHIYFRNPHHLTLLIALILGAVGAVWVYSRTNPPISRTKAVILGILRFIAIAGIIFMLADPIVLSVYNREIVPSVVVLVDNSQSMALKDKLGDRAQITKDLLNSGALKELSKKYPMHRFSFSDSLRPLGELKFDGRVTAIGEAISELIDTAQFLDIGAALLISDGQSNYGVDPISVAALSPFVIYTIGVGDTTPAPDIAISQVVSNPVAYAGEKTPIVAYITAWQLGAKKVNVQIFDGAKKVAEKTVELPARGESVPVKFEVTPKQAGQKYYTVRVPPVKSEFSVSNNSRTVAVKVLPAKKKILIACDHPSFEVSFFRRVLMADPHIQTELFIKRGGGDAKFKTFPTDTARLNKYDAVVLIHSAPILTEQVARALAEYVTGGGSVLWIADDSMPTAGAIEHLNRFLPVHIPKTADFVRSKFVPVLSADGYTHPVTRIGSSGENIADEIAQMPPFVGYIPAEPSEGASVLLIHPETGRAVLSVAQVGQGRSAAICAAPLWKWGFLPFGFGKDDRVYRGLVSNLMQYLLAKEKISRFVLKPGRRVYRSGETIVISASVRDVSNNPVSGAEVKISILPENGDTSQKISLSMTEVEQGVYEVRLPSLAKGKYIVSGVAKLRDKIIGRGKTNFVVEEFQVEFAQTNQDRPELEEIARVSGGRYAPADSAEYLLSAINLAPRTKSWTEENELRNSAWLLVIIVFALSLEWFLRKRSNLL